MRRPSAWLALARLAHYNTNAELWLNFALAFATFLSGAAHTVRSAEQKFYSDDPIAMAEKWASYGVEMIHVVDLDGARTGELKNLGVVAEIVEDGEEAFYFYDEHPLSDVKGLIADIGTAIKQAEVIQ